MKDCRLVGHVLYTNSVFSTYHIRTVQTLINGCTGHMAYIYSYIHSGSLRCINYTVRGQQIKYHTVLIIHNHSVHNNNT